jgi:hypothetical protein
MKGETMNWGKAVLFMIFTTMFSLFGIFLGNISVSIVGGVYFFGAYFIHTRFLVYPDKNGLYNRADSMDIRYSIMTGVASGITLSFIWNNSLRIGGILAIICLMAVIAQIFSELKIRRGEAMHHY